MLQKECIANGFKGFFESTRSNAAYRSRNNIRLVVSHIFLFTQMLKMPTPGRLPEFIGTSNKI